MRNGLHIEHNGDGSGDWIRISRIIDASVLFEGHSVSPYDLVRIFRDVGMDVSCDLHMSDEEME